MPLQEVFVKPAIARNEEQSSHAVELLAAIARRDANPEDLTAEFRKQGADGLDLIALLARRAAQPRPDPATAQSWIDVSQFARPTEPRAAARIVHRVPKVPFLLNGTLYDPQDIARFNGRELHFVVAKDSEPLLVIDDRPLIARWWELTYLTSMVAAAEPAEQYQYGGHQTIAPQVHGGDHPPIPPGKGQGGPGVGGGTVGAPSKPTGTYLFEDSWRQGESVLLRPNREFRDLRKVGRGLFDLGDWNDVISSVYMYFTYVCVLHEHIADEGGGPTLTLYLHQQQAHLNLDIVGWNDRASWVATW